MDTLSLLGVEALKQGVAFLFDQARQLLDRRREAASARLPEGVFTGELDPGRYDEEALTRAESALRALRAELFPYVDDATLIDPGNRRLTTLVDQLRYLLEGIYQQHITFVTETDRADSGIRLRADVDINRIVGQVTGVEAGTISEGEVEARMRIDEVAEGGSVTGIKTDRIGGGRQ